MAITIAYDKSVQGWTSEYTFIPDSGLSLNNHYYTFKSGRIWRHNVDNVDNRNDFYGVYGDTIIEFIFNDDPSTVKNFKTIMYEGEGEFETSLSTNIENGYIESAHYLERDGERMAWIRGEPNLDAAEDPIRLDLKNGSVGGIGAAVDVTIVEPDGINLPASYITFSSVPSALSVGDLLYLSEMSNNNNTDPVPVGKVTSINGNDVHYDAVILGGVQTQTPVNGNFILYAKDNSVEKSGIIGYFSVVTMTNSSPEMVELFSVGTEIVPG